MKPAPSAASARWPAGRAPWLILALFTALALVLSWPVILHLGSRVPGTATWAFDESTFLWNQWYLKHSLLDLHNSPLHTELTWYPLGMDLILYTFNFFNALIGLPLQLAGNLPLAANLTQLLATVLSGFGAYLVALYVLRRVLAGQRAPTVLRLAALVAGVIYAFSANRAVYAALGHYNFATTQWLPFYALYLLRTLHRPGWRNGLLAGLFFALAALAETTFASFLALFSLVVVLVWLREPAARGARWRGLGGVALAALVAATLWAPVLAPTVREFVRGDYALTGWGESLKLSADLKGLVTPTELNPLFAGATDRAGADGQMARWQMALRAVEEGTGPFSDINTVFLGWVTLALAALGAVLGRRRLRAWIWAAVVFGVLSLGPLLQIGGRYLFSFDGLLPGGVSAPLPFILLHYIPFISANRAPNRNSLILMLALAVLAAYGVAWVLGRIGKQGNKETRKQGNKEAVSTRGLLVYLSTCFLGILILAEHLAVPMPTTDATIPAVYQQIAAEPGQFTVMQLPLGWRDSFGVLGSEQTQLQYFQTATGKPIIGGNTSRAPAYKMDYFARIPLFRALTDLELYRTPSPETDAAARAQAGQLMALYDVRYFVTTPPIAGRYPYQDTWQQTEAYALDVLPLEDAPVWEQDGYRVYRVEQPDLPFPFRVDLGAAGQEPHLGGGWDVRTDEQPYSATAVWATATTADLYLPLAGPRNDPVQPGGRTLRLAIAPLTYDGAPAQRVTIRVNDVTVLEDHVLAPGWQTVEAAVPASAVRAGASRVRLQFGQAVSPRQAFPDPASRAMIGATGVVSPVNLDVHGFSEAFISAFDASGAETKASAGRRGYNVAVLDPHTGKVLEMRGFDTAANPYEADALASYLRDIPAGRIVAVTTKGDATANLTPAAVEALRGIGSRAGSPADLAGNAHALIGVRGGTPGTAAEEIKPGDAFVRVAGDFRSLAAAVDWVELDAGN